MSDESEETGEHTEPSSTEILEGRDFYWENGLIVMTAEFLKRRGYCCDSGCRHCPYTAKSDRAANDLTR